MMYSFKAELTQGKFNFLNLLSPYFNQIILFGYSPIFIFLNYIYTYTQVIKR